MRNTELVKYREILLNKQRELSRGLLRDRIAVPKRPEMEEEAQMIMEQDLAIRNRTQEANWLRRIRAALDRIADGSYGICVSCEEEIRPQRLEAVPWTPYCARCQNILEQQETEGVARQPEHIGVGNPPQERAA